MTEWLRTNVAGNPVGVDRERRIIYGYVVAEAGPFKTKGRGEFNETGLAKVVELMGARPAGTKSRFAHPDLSGDGIGKFLGRSKNPRIDNGKVRADLHLDPSSFHTPSGNLGGYLLDLAENDPQAFGSSLVLQTAKEYRKDKDGNFLSDEEGERLPPLWFPTRVHASDVVDEGDAVHGGFLAVETIDVAELPDEALWEGCAILDRLFAGKSREQVQEALQGFLARYLDRRYGPAKNLIGLLRKKMGLRQREPLTNPS